MKNKYYSLSKILRKNATYNVIFGERSNGKTYAVLKHALEKYWKTREQLAIVRRWTDDFVGKRGQTIMSSLTSNGNGENIVSKITEGEWTGVYYYASKWFLCRYDENEKRETSEDPFAYGFSITAQEHDKMTSYPRVTTILFDEFLTRTGYVTDEFVLFMNVISTIVRKRDNVKIFMLGNTVNKFCPYFGEMGLKHVREMKQGSIDLYQYGDTRLTVAVEYVKPNKEGKESDFYFAFDNPKLQMITGGEWEIDIYPHLPMKYEHKHIMFEYFIEYDNQILHAEIVCKDGCLFTFIHPKTTPIQDEKKDLIYSPEKKPYPNWTHNILRPVNKLQKRVLDIFRQGKIFYLDNETGEVMRNYLQYCQSA